MDESCSGGGSPQNPRMWKIGVSTTHRNKFPRCYHTYTERLDHPNQPLNIQSTLKQQQRGKLYSCLGTVHYYNTQLWNEMAGLQQICSLFYKSYCWHSVFKPASLMVRHMAVTCFRNAIYSVLYKSVTGGVALTAQHVTTK